MLNYRLKEPLGERRKSKADEERVGTSIYCERDRNMIYK